MERLEHWSPAGSRVRPVSTSSWEIKFEWLDEEACVEAVPQVDETACLLRWSCKCCDDAGLTDLMPNTN